MAKKGKIHTKKRGEGGELMDSKAGKKGGCTPCQMGETMLHTGPEIRCSGVKGKGKGSPNLKEKSVEESLK